MKSLETICWIIGILLVVEFGLEIRANRRGYDTILFGSATRTSSSQSATSAAFGPTTQFPFRSPVVARARTPGVDRIWLASASYGEDSYVEPHLIFPNLAAEMLGARGYPTEILNASRAGNTIGSNIVFMNEQAAMWSPRAAILYQMSLDINILAERLLGAPGDKGTDSVHDAEGATTIVAGPQTVGRPNVLVRYYESSTIYKTLKELMGGRATQQRVLAHTLGPRAAHMFRQVLLDFVASAKALEIEPILCTFATSHDASNIAQIPVAYLNSVFRYNIYLSMTGWVHAIAELNDVVREVAASESLELIDVEIALGGHPEFFRDYVHFNQRGHAALAELLAAAMTVKVQATE